MSKRVGDEVINFFEGSAFYRSDAMSSDLQLQQRVIDELEFEPEVDAAHIGVTARDGIVTLTGRVSSFLEKLAAEQAAKRVKGVKGVAQDIEIHYAADPKTADDEIAARVIKVLQWHMAVPADRISVKVDHGVVIAHREVDWYYQKTRAEEDARRLGGVREVLNEITVVVALRAEDIRQQINAALDRQARFDSNTVTVVVMGGEVTLGGKVEREELRTIAERVAWSAKGVSEVSNLIRVANHTRH